ncbi:MAG: MarC family protein [Chlorobiaceae bacterium]|nr:MarC family protein [Chlorobiaceae bacterium]NTW74638.1 MarC family protein [Chlorobiaceae bacterium]
MVKTAAIAFATFLATVGPVDLAALLAALTPYHTQVERRAVAVKAVGIATCILLVFAFGGNALLSSLGISLAALRISGGILLLLMAVGMVFGEAAGSRRPSGEEALEAMQKPDISVFPMATPLIAGPATIGASLLLMAETRGEILLQLAVVGALLAVLLITLLLFMAASTVQRILGVTGLHVVSRMIGVVLSALAVQFMLDGLLQSGLVGS